jgi:hypothetical protein
VPTSAFTVIVVLCALVRLYASWDNFWFDEIWSWQFATEADSYWQIATQIRHDNNHILNTWIIHSFPPESHWSVYRFPAVLAGTGTVILAGLCGFRRSGCEGITALLLTGGSFVLIEYSSEARGYSYLLFFTMLCIWLMERTAKARRIGSELLFGLSASLGMLAHFSFAAVYAGLIAWSILDAVRCLLPWTHRGLRLLRLHLLPVITIAMLAGWNGFQMKIGGGHRLRLADVVIQAGSLAVGGPNGGWLGILACGLAIGSAIAGMILLIRRGEGVCWFWIITTIVFALVIATTRPDVIYVRYFLVEILGALLLLTHLLSWIWHRGTLGKWAYIVALGAILVGNAVQLWPFLEFGRGGYQQAVEYIQAQSPDDEISIGSDHDFRNPKLLDYYLRRSPNSKAVVYYRNGQWAPGGPDWVILHSFQQPLGSRQELHDASGNRFRRVREFPYGGLSGWHWILYQRDTDQHQRDTDQRATDEEPENE